jgi:carboxylesterase type B
LAAGGDIPALPPLTVGQDEDCLFLNVYAPKGAKNLPVYVWIHGGGYGQGDGSQDLQEFITSSGNGFIAVSMNYRVS